jgi:hypothetical protein
MSICQGRSRDDSRLASAQIGYCSVVVAELSQHLFGVLAEMGVGRSFSDSGVRVILIAWPTILIAQRFG